MWRILPWHDITTASRERRIVSFYCLFNSLCKPTSKKHQSPRCWPSVRGTHRWPMNFPHKGPVTLKKLPFDDASMTSLCTVYIYIYDCGNSIWFGCVAKILPHLEEACHEQTSLHSSPSNVFLSWGIVGISPCWTNWRQSYRRHL